MSVTDVWHVAEKVIDEEKVPITVMQEVLGCRLLEVEQGDCAFRHELLLRFLAAEAFTIRHAVSSELGLELSKPRNRDLAEFVLGLQTQPSCVRACLKVLADAALLDSCFRGEAGPVAEAVVKEDAMSLCRMAQAELDEITLEIHQTEHGRDELRVCGGREWLPYEKALLSALGRRTREATSLEESLRLLVNTWNTCLERLEKRYGPRAVQKRSVLSFTFAELFVRRGCELPASLISFACQECFMAARTPQTPHKMLALCEQATKLSAPELYLIFHILKESLVDASPLVSSLLHVVPSLLKVGWETGIYNVQLEALEFAQFAARSVDESIRDEIVTLLNSFKTLNAFLSTAVVETLLAYNQLEPLVSVEGASAEIDDILKTPDDPSARNRAYAAVSNIFEEIFQDSFYEAIEKLNQDDRVRLLTMAALNGESSFSFSLDWILKELIKSKNRIAVPAFLRWANELVTETPFRQKATTCFMFACVGCAQHLDDPPALKSTPTDDHRAWQLFGEIIFWSHKPQLTESQKREQCLPLWRKLAVELPFEAVDPLYHFAHSRSGIPGQLDPVGKLFADFRDQIRELLEFGLKNRDRLSSMDKHAVWPYYKTERNRFIVQSLGDFGNFETLRILEPLVDTQELGSEALAAMRKLKGLRP
jgi:hypothetical protein